LKRTPTRRDELTGVALAVVAGASFGTLAIFAKFGYDDGADPLPLLAVRFAITSLLLVTFHLVTRRRLRIPPPTAIKLLALGAFGYAFEASLFFFALDYAPAGVVSLIFFSYPLWTTVIAVATRLERFEPRVAGALLLGTGGVATIFSIDSGDIRGPLLAFAAALVVAIYFLFAQIVSKDVDPAASATWTAFGATAALSIALLFTSWEFPADALAPATALGLATAFSFVTIYAAIARLGSARVSIASMFEPVTTVLLAALFLEEEITIRIALGAVLVVIALPVLVGGSRDQEASVVASDTV
jgi:drug/metabolite transporter (DMT)-like permease